MANADTLTTQRLRATRRMFDYGHAYYVGDEIITQENRLRPRLIVPRELGDRARRFLDADAARVANNWDADWNWGLVGPTTTSTDLYRCPSCHKKQLARASHESWCLSCGREFNYLFKQNP